MNYSELFRLKFKKGLSTHALMERYPRDVKRISAIALLDVDEGTLLKIVPKPRLVSHLRQLRKKFMPLSFFRFFFFRTEALRAVSRKSLL